MQRISIVPATGTGAQVVLGDDSETNPRTIILTPPWLPAPEIQIQTAMPIRARNAKVWARGGIVTTYTFHVSRYHASVSAAEQFKRDHVKQVCTAIANGQFVLTHASFGVSMKSTGALKTPRCMEQVGLRTVFNYEWIGTTFE